MKIEAGKYYRTRGGDVVGPMAQGNDKRYRWIIFSGIVNSLRWNQDGDYSYAGEHSLDLVAKVYVNDTPLADAPALEAKTLRDEFAMAALTGFMADPNVLLPTCDFNATAEGLYVIADAMMEARKK
jgi:hypothetical protein